MRTLFILLFIAITATFAKSKAASPLFWKVQGTHNTVYLLGSIHVGKPSLYPLPSVIEQAYQNSQTFVVEVNTEKIKPKHYIPYVTLPEDTTVAMLFDNATLVELGKIAQEYQIPYSYIEHKQPWFFMQYLLMQAVAQAGYSASYGTESYFLTHKGTKKVKQLETFTEQMTLFTTLFTPEYFKLSLGDIKDAKKDIKKLYTSWRTGDSTKLHALVIDSTIANLPSESTVMDKLFYQRNKKMATRIIPYLSEVNNVFISVGTGHFLGNKGIISLLKKQGYTVTRIETTNEK